ncbi:hypothetical protein [Tardiphaga sp.]|uniref:hypothetical protein n=1 Tax=Tardiphaga sp. TaxID=1926292 RepID=UPI002614A043|nr:hypothetical protein [Tardiphaga sp.]MDB5616035.1 hypothetical protein [Tardiphaga sp.]
MKCHQCPTPAFYRIEHFGQDVPICLDCYTKLRSLNHVEFLMNAAMLNQAQDDMDAMMPFGSSGGRIPIGEIARAMKKPSHVYNNIKVSNSQVGVLNTGDLAKIDAVITISTGSDIGPIGDQLKALTQAVVDCGEMNDVVKRDMIDLINVLATQIVSAKSERKPSVITSLYKTIEDRAKGFAAISTVANALGAEIGRLFG